MKFGSVSLLLIFAFLLTSLTACDKEEDKEAYDGPILAKVNGVAITPEDFVISMDLLYQPHERREFMTDRGKAQFLQLMAAMEMFYQEGKRQGLDKNERIEKAVENYRRYIVYHTLMTQNINTETMKRFYLENYFHVALIKFAVPKSADEKDVGKVRVKAEKVLAEIGKGADFAEMALKHSADPSGSNGGDPGPITMTGQYPVEVLRAAGTLKEPGELAPLVEAPDGFYIIKLVEPYGQLDPGEMTEEVQQTIYNTMVKMNYENFARQLQLMSDIELYPENLKLIGDVAEKDKQDFIIPNVPTPGIKSVGDGR